jgi:hypothetical protein
MASIEMPPLKSRDSSGGRVSTPGQQLNLTTPSLNGNEISSTSASEKKYSCRHFAAKVLQNLNFLRQSTRFCDVEIVAGGRIMKVRSSNISKVAFLVIFYILHCCVMGYIYLNFCICDCCHHLRIYLTLRLLNPTFHLSLCWARCKSETKNKKENGNLYRGINGFKKGYQSGSNMTKYGKEDLLVFSIHVRISSVS